MPPRVSPAPLFSTRTISLPGVGGSRACLGASPCSSVSAPSSRRFATALPDTFVQHPRRAPHESDLSDDGAPSSSDNKRAPKRDLDLAIMAEEIIAMSRPEYLLRYGSRIKDKLSQLGFESVEDFTKFQESKKREDQARVLLNVRRSGDKEDVLKVKEMSATTAPTTSKRKAGTKTANMASPSATAPNMKSYGAMPGKSLDSIVQLDKFAALDVPQIEELWTKYHSTKDCLSAVVPAATYDKMMKNGGEFPMFLIPLPRDKGFEFFILQFQNNQIHFTSLHAYQTLGPSCRPYLTLTHYPELRDSKGVVLMRGEVDAAVLGKEMGMDEAKLLALYMQAYYVEPSERKKQLLKTFHHEPGKFNYQDVIDEMEKLV